MTLADLRWETPWGGMKRGVIRLAAQTIDPIFHASLALDLG